MTTTKMAHALIQAIALCLLLPYNSVAQQKPAAKRPAVRPATTKRPVAAPAVSRPKLPIEYVDQFNHDSHDDKNNSGRYMAASWCAGHLGDDGCIATPEMWVGVFPLDGTVSFEDDDQVLDHYEYVTIAGETAAYEADYQRNMRTCYAIRFKDDSNRYRCAYRYKKVGSFRNDGNLSSGLEVQVIYLGPHFKGSLKTIANEAYWTANRAKAIRRYFPAAGYFSSSDLHSYGSDNAPVTHRGCAGYYFTSVHEDSKYVTVVINGSGVSQTYLFGLHQLPFRRFTVK